MELILWRFLDLSFILLERLCTTYEKAFILLLAMILCLGISAPAMAVSAPDLDTVNQKAANIWISLRNANMISANEEGILSVANETLMLAH